MQPTQPDVVSTYWTYKRLSSGDRSERLAANELFWAWEQVSEAMEGPLSSALTLLDALLVHPEADPVAVGAGPLEDLLLRTDAPVGDEVAARCRESAVWRRAAAAVWLDDVERARLPELSPFLTSAHT